MTDSISAVQPATTQQQINPYAIQTSGTMATDFFGSQAFGGNFTGMGQQTPMYNFEPPENIGSALVQQCYAQNNPSFMGGTGGATAQDYYMATQIANQFANNQPLISPYDSFFQSDMFAQQLVPQNNQYNNGMNYMA